MTPLVSVIIPTHNRAALTLEAIAGARAQTYRVDFAQHGSLPGHRERQLAKSFIDRISSDPEAHRLAPAVLDLAHALGLESVAEGIEHADQIAHLIEMRCTLGQGIHISKPVPAHRLAALLGPSTRAGHATHALATSRARGTA